jgi:hypothetical protein
VQKVGVNVIEDEVCSEWYASQGKSFRVKYGQMCAGHENGGRDACGVIFNIIIYSHGMEHLLFFIS